MLCVNSCLLLNMQLKETITLGDITNKKLPTVHINMVQIPFVLNPLKRCNYD